MAHNALGTELQICSTDPMTGFYRAGCCDTGEMGAGVHVVCARMTDEFPAFTRLRGNDLSRLTHFMRPETPRPRRWRSTASLEN